MQNPLQTPLQRMPEISSALFEVPVDQEKYRAPASPLETSPYIEHITASSTPHRETNPGRLKFASAPEVEAGKSKILANRIIKQGTNVISARESEIRLEGGLQLGAGLGVRRSEQKLSLGEALLGKKGAEKLSKLFAFQPSDNHDRLDEQYMDRERTVGKRLLGSDFFCQDVFTWVWSIEDNGTLKTFIYHIRPNDGVVRQYVDLFSPNRPQEGSRIGGEELETFQYWTSRYETEVLSTVYRKDPAISATGQLATVPVDITSGYSLAA